MVLWFNHCQVRVEKLEPQMLVECAARHSYSLSGVSFPPLARHSCVPVDTALDSQDTSACIHLSCGLEMNTEPACAGVTSGSEESQAVLLFQSEV